MNLYQNLFRIHTFFLIHLTKPDIIFTFKYLLNESKITNVNWGNNSQFEEVEGDLFLSVIPITQIRDFDISKTGLSKDEQIAIATSPVVQKHISHFCIKKDETMNDQFATYILKKIDFNFFETIPNGNELRLTKYTFKKPPPIKPGMNNTNKTQPQEPEGIPNFIDVPLFKYCFTSH